jgi:hypothetical protein
MTDKMASPKEGLFAVVQQLEIVPSEFFSLTTPYFFLPRDTTLLLCATRICKKKPPPTGFQLTRICTIDPLAISKNPKIEIRVWWQSLPLSIYLISKSKLQIFTSSKAHS